MRNSLEVEFIMKQHVKLSNSMNYWIGGATTSMGTVELSEYMQHHACEGKENACGVIIHALTIHIIIIKKTN